MLNCLKKLVKQGEINESNIIDNNYCRSILVIIHKKEKIKKGEINANTKNSKNLLPLL